MGLSNGRGWPCTLFGLWMLAAAAPQTISAVEPVEREETWQIIQMSGQRIGYSRSLVEPFERDGESLIRASVETHLTIKRFGQTLRMATTLLTEETLDGSLRQFTFEMANPPKASTRTAGRIEGDKLVLESEVGGRKKTVTKDWDSELKSPVYQDRLLRDQPLKPGDNQTFKAYLPELGSVATVKITADKRESVALLDGKSAELLKVRITQSAIPGIVTNGWLNAEGETLKSSTPMLGTDMVTYTVSQDEALKSIDTAELDLAVSTLIQVKPIPGVHDRKEITYRIEIPDQDPGQFLAADDVQTVTKLDDHSAELTIRALAVPDQSVSADSPGKEYLESTEYLQAEDSDVRRHADEAAGKETSPGKIALAMEKYVRDHLTQKNFSTALASAAEVARTMEGDCTEHAVLLAAMLRAKQVPSRVAVGIVYVELNQQPSFGGHMWTEAWLNGKWVPLDATMARGGTHAGHIKLGASSFAEDQATPIATFTPLMLAIGKMQIQVKE